MMIKSKHLVAGLLLCGLLNVYTSMHAQTKTIAHRGYWDCEGSAQNSIKSLKEAAIIKSYGSEFDVKMTADGKLIVNHDDMIGEYMIETTPYSKIKKIKLKNGETLPTLSKYLDEGKRNENIKLILEIKPHSTKEIEDKVVEKVVKLVNKYKLENRVDYISFSINICKQLAKLSPNSEVAYLGGKLSPNELKELGLTGLDYHYSEYERNPQWIEEAKSLGLSTNVWTVNDPEKMQTLIDQQIDFITTDKPVELQQLLIKE